MIQPASPPIVMSCKFLGGLLLLSGAVIVVFFSDIAAVPARCINYSEPAEYNHCVILAEKIGLWRTHVHGCYLMDNSHDKCNAVISAASQTIDTCRVLSERYECDVGTFNFYELADRPTEYASFISKKRRCAVNADMSICGGQRTPQNATTAAALLVVVGMVMFFVGLTILCDLRGR